VAKVGPRLIRWNVALLVVQFIQPILALARHDAPVVAAFHPVLALVIFWLALTIGLMAWRLVPTTRDRSRLGHPQQGRFARRTEALGGIGVLAIL
jgi:hypothetical protein